MMKLKVISKEMTVKFLKRRKQKPIFFVDVGLPGNIDPEISKISNCYLFDLNDLEQFFTLFLVKITKKMKIIMKIFSNEKIRFFQIFLKKLSFNENQKKIFKNYFEDFFLKIVKRIQRESFFKIF